MIPIGKDRSSRRFPAVMWLLLLANAAIFVYQLQLGPDAERFIRRWGLVPVRLWILTPVHGESGLLAAWVPMLSSMFLHGGWLHILGNLLALRVFGDHIEEKLGHIRFLIFYVLCGILAGLLHALIHAGSKIPTIGASGAIAGILGAYLLLFPFEWIRVIVPVFFFPISIKLPAILYLVFWAATQALGGYQTLTDGTAVAGGIAFWAHIGGFCAGMYWIRRWRVRRR